MSEFPALDKKCVAFFDFDGTLVEGDSLWPFLILAAGRPRCLIAALCAVMARFGVGRGKDKRTVFKEKLLYHALRGVSLSAAEGAAARLRKWPRWIDKTVEALKRHHREGHRVVIASGSLDLYLDVLLKDLPCDDILCTEMEVVGGKLTGHMVSGNCVRERKADCVSRYIAANGPFDESWAYGNAPHDLPMMEWVDNRVIV